MMNVDKQQPALNNNKQVEVGTNTSNSVDDDRAELWPKRFTIAHANLFLAGVLFGLLYAVLIFELGIRAHRRNFEEAQPAQNTTSAKIDPVLSLISNKFEKVENELQTSHISLTNQIQEMKQQLVSLEENLDSRVANVTREELKFAEENKMGPVDDLINMFNNISAVFWGIRDRMCA